MKRILIYGISSFKNRGVEALFNSTIAQIPQEVELVVAMFDPYGQEKYKTRVTKFIKHYRMDENEFTEQEKKQYDYIQSIPFDYYNYECLYQRDVMKEIENCDLCIHIGGDNYCYEACQFLYAVNRKAKELGKKTVLWGASLFDEIQDMELIDNLEKYDLLMLRESLSYDAVKKYIEEEKLLLIPDPAFSLEKKKVSLDPWYQKRKVLGLNLSPLTIQTDLQKEAIFDLIDFILKNTDYSISLIPHVTVEDVSDFKILEPIKEKYSEEDRIFLEKEYDCQELKYIISKCHLIIAARTHASIAAYSTLVPTLVLGYSVKSRGIAEEIFGTYKNYVLPIEELNSENLISSFRFLDQNQKNIQATLKNKMKVMTKEAMTLYEKMMSQLDILEQQYVCPKNQCTGCTACLNTCPHHAISLELDSNGFYYPKIDLKKCVHCNLCRKNCCIQNKKYVKDKDSYIACFACKAKDSKLVKESSSGGVFTLLARKILNEKGVVYGAALEELKVVHQRVEKEEDLFQLRGSKYVQSDLSFTFQQVKEDLEKKKQVLFSGVPCQLLGLKMFLGKEYENLYTVSVICHGITNQEIWKRRIHELERKFSSKMKHVFFKSKEKGWENSQVLYQMDRINKSYPTMEDSFMYLYLKNYILRNSCYQCPAKGCSHNIADLVLGDYWGIYNVHREFFDPLGVSAVIIKTVQGKKLFDQIKEDMDIQETDYENICQYNPAFENSMDRPREYHQILYDLKENSISFVADYCRLKEELATKKIDHSRDEEVEKLREELLQVYHSKRYQLANKVFGIVDWMKKR